MYQCWGSPKANDTLVEWIDGSTLVYTFFTKNGTPRSWVQNVAMSQFAVSGGRPGARCKIEHVYAEPASDISGIDRYECGRRVSVLRGTYGQYHGTPYYDSEDEEEAATREPWVAPKPDYTEEALLAAQQRLAFSKTLHPRLAVPSPAFHMLPMRADGGGDLHDAIGGQVTITKTNPEDKSDALKAKGNSAFRSGKMALAKKHFEAALQFDEWNHVLWSNLAAVYLKSKRYSAALKSAQRCVALRPGFLKGWHRAGQALEGLGKQDQAKATYLRGFHLSRTSFVKQFAWPFSFRAESILFEQGARIVRTFSRAGSWIDGVWVDGPRPPPKVQMLGDLLADRSAGKKPDPKPPQVTEVLRASVPDGADALLRCLLRLGFSRLELAVDGSRPERLRDLKQEFEDRLQELAKDDADDSLTRFQDSISDAMERIDMALGLQAGQHHANRRSDDAKPRDEPGPEPEPELDDGDGSGDGYATAEEEGAEPEPGPEPTPQPFQAPTGSFDLGGGSSATAAANNRKGRRASMRKKKK